MNTRDKKKSLLLLFFKSLIISLLVILLIAGGIFVFYKTYLSPSSAKYNDPLNNNNSVSKANSKKTLNKNIVVFGVDKDQTHTDTIMVVHFDSALSKASIISVPRDTKVFWTEEQIDKADELGVPSRSYSKITEMNAYAGLENIRDFTVSTLEDLLGIKIDNYFVVNTSILREVVDAIGGVEFDVPRVMKYSDPYQDLYIDLEPGLQVLDGRQAEGVLRWRHNNSYSEQYAEGDVGRIETQQKFVQAFTKKVLSPEIFKNLIPLVKTTYENITTDMSLFDILSYIPYLNNFSTDNITMTTIPGEAVKEELWYYIVSEDEVKTFVQDALSNKVTTPSPTPAASATPSDSEY